MLSNDPRPQPSPAGPLEPTHTIDRLLRRALGVPPAPDPPLPDTWSAASSVPSDFWGEAKPGLRLGIPTVRRPGGARAIASIALVGGLAVAWIATSQMGRSGRPAAVAPPGVSTTEGRRPAPPVTGSDQPRPDASRGVGSLRALVPSAAQCGYGPHRADQARCSLGGVEVAYELLSRDAARADYLAAVGTESSVGTVPTGSRPGSGRPACALGGEDERSWSRPAAPRRAVGRYACRIEQGRAAMWWTVDDRGLLAHATAAGSDLSSLFAWWESHSER